LTTPPTGSVVDTPPHRSAASRPAFISLHASSAHLTSSYSIAAGGLDQRMLRVSRRNLPPSKPSQVP
jgi:hypothetical protein